MKLRVLQVGVGLELDDFMTDNKIQKVKQISLQTKPIFSEKSKNLYIAAGSDINVYNTHGGNLQNVLKKHEYNIISIVKYKSTTEDHIISCDEKLNIFTWKIGCNDNDKLLALKWPVDCSKYQAVYFGLGNKSSFLVNFVNLVSGFTLLFQYCNPFNFKPKFITRDIIAGFNTVATSSDGQFLAAVTHSQKLFVTNLSNSKNGNFTMNHKSSKKLCCLTFHPVDNIVAVGDITGAITLWYNIMERIPVKMMIHWHTLPVGDLAFSSDGNELYSGGGESVIVRWQLNESNQRSFLPRLGMPIHYISTDESNTFFAALHVDKAVSIINAREMVLEGLIQSLSLYLSKDSKHSQSVGLLHHPKMNALIMNGKIGHLQFLNPINSSVLFNLDITMSNFVSRDRKGELPNSDVTLASVSDDGTWLVTTESCQLTKYLTEIYLKFWYFSTEEQRWELNTSIQMPHNDNITAITIASSKYLKDVPMCVTGSEDGKFKLWKLIEYLDVQGKERSHWNSRAVQEFRSLPVTSTLFSPDNSLIAVAFHSVITLWTPDEGCSLLGTLSQPYLSERIRDMCFSYGEREGSLLVSRSDNYLFCWDLLSCSLKWRVSLQSTCLTVEKSSGVMVVFSKNKEVIFFDPHSSEPLQTIQAFGSEILGATFVPSDEKFTVNFDVPWKSNRSIYFVDKEQVLFTVKNEDHLDAHLSKSVNKSLNQLTSDHHREVDRTLYSAIMARTRNITRPNMENDVVNISTTKISCSLMERLNRVDVHNMESMAHFMEFLYLFPPELKRCELDATKNESLKYNTVKENLEEVVERDRELKDPSKLSKVIEIVDTLDYKNIISFLNS